MELTLASLPGWGWGAGRLRLRLWVSGILACARPCALTSTTETRLSCLGFLSEGLPLPSTKESRFKLE